MEKLFGGWLRALSRDGSVIFDAFLDNRGMEIHPPSGVVVVYYASVEPNKPLLADLMAWGSFVDFLRIHKPTILQKDQFLFLTDELKELFAE